VVSEVAYCTNSTITEAWAVIAGLPTPLDLVEEVLIWKSANRRIPELALEEAIVAVKGNPQVAPPFWKSQVSWQGGERMARFGHRFLSIHYRPQRPNLYRTYEESVRPSIETWLEIVRSSGADLVDESIDVVGFGYVNQFAFEPEANFDLSRYFRLNVGVHVGDPSPALTGLKTTFHFSVAAPADADLVLALSAESPDERGPITVTTRVFAERRGTPNLSWTSLDDIAALIREVKEVAKAAFFGFATEETHRIMGAQIDVAAQA
jgi:hypothetical protein